MVPESSKIFYSTMKYFDKHILTISDWSLLQIIKVRPQSIMFKYADDLYLLYGCYEGDEFVDCAISAHWLYKVNMKETGYYSLEVIARVDERWGVNTLFVLDDYIYLQKGKTVVYSQVDKKYFAYKLTLRGLADGVLEKDVKKAKRRIVQLQRRVGTFKRYEETLKEKVFKFICAEGIEGEAKDRVVKLIKDYKEQQEEISKLQEELSILD